MKTKHIIIISVSVVILVLLGAFIYVQKQKQAYDKDKQEFVNLQKQALEEELNNLHTEYENQYNKLKIGNGERTMMVNTDSLLNKLLAEKNKVDRLNEELKDIRNTTAQHISKLNKEVGTLKTILRSYIVQVDSLNNLNKKLYEENQAVKKSYNRVTQQNKELKREKETLADQVQIASRLDVSNLKVALLDNRGRITSRIYRIKKIAISFIIPRNVTAKIGYKTIYARLLDPNGSLMEQDNAFSDTFHFENKDIKYSIKRDIEYNGEDTNVTMYWDVNSTLLEGPYRVALFIDGNLVGQTTFELN